MFIYYTQGVNKHSSIINKIMCFLFTRNHPCLWNQIMWFSGLWCLWWKLL